MITLELDFQMSLLENVITFFNILELRVQEYYCNILKATLETLPI